MIQIYEWDVIDMKMKEHLSKKQFQLYNKVKNSRIRPHSSNSNLQKKHRKTNKPLKFSFLEQNKQRVGQRPCLQLKPKTNNQDHPNKKNQPQLSINQTLAIRQYDFEINPTKSSAQKKYIPNVLTLRRSPFLQVQLHKRVLSETKSIKTPEPASLTKNTDKSQTKIQRNQKYSVFSTCMTITKVSLPEKNTVKRFSQAKSRKNSISMQNISFMSLCGSEKQIKKSEERMEFKRLSLRPNTAKNICTSENSNTKKFLDLILTQKKPLKL